MTHPCAACARRREKGAAVLALQELASAAQKIDEIATVKARGRIRADA